MYKTLNTVTVTVIGNSNPIPFADSAETPGVGTAALNQILAEQDVEGYEIGDDGRSNYIIPYHAIEYATVETTRSEAEYEDDTQKNCTESGGGGDTGTVTITNAGTGQILMRLSVFSEPSDDGLMTNINGTYGDVTFANGQADDIRLDGGASLTIANLPVGVFVMANYSTDGADDEMKYTTVPGTISVNGLAPD